MHGVSTGRSVDTYVIWRRPLIMFFGDGANEAESSDSGSFFKSDHSFCTYFCIRGRPTYTYLLVEY